MSRSRSALCVLAAAAVLGMAACGDDDSSTTAATGATTPTTSATGAVTTTGGGETSAGSTASTGGGAAPTTGAPKKADDSMSPVLVGFHNLEGGAISLPEIRTGFEEGMKYVNEELGGINGHPVKIESCKLDVTPESSVNCANQFVEKKVVMAVQGVDVAADAALPILKQAGIAEVAFFAFTPAVNKVQGDAFVTLFSQEEGYAADLMTQQKLGAKREAMLSADLPTAHAVVEEVVQPTAKKLGLTVTPFYYPTQTDWTSFAATVLASNPDAVSLPAAEDQVCLGAVPALRAAGFTGIIHASSCAEIINQLDASALENVITHNEFYYPTFTSIPPKPQHDIDIFMKYMKRDAPDFKSLVYTQLGFHVAVQAADMLRQVPGDVTAASVKKTLPTAKGQSFFRDSGYDCSKPTWPGTTACASGIVFTKITKDKRKEVLPFSPIDPAPVKPPG